MPWPRRRYSVYYGEGRDAYDVRGRMAHESIFNSNDGTYRCPNSQQGYSPFSTWTRGLAWAMCGFAEQLEFLADLDVPRSGRSRAHRVVSEGRPGHLRFLHRPGHAPPMAFRTGTPARPALQSWAIGRAAPADPFNAHEPVDSSAAAIAAQGSAAIGALPEHSDKTGTGTSPMPSASAA